MTTCSVISNLPFRTMIVMLKYYSVPTLFQQPFCKMSLAQLASQCLLCHSNCPPYDILDVTNEKIT